MTKKEIKDYIQAVIEHAISNVEYGNYFLSVIKGMAEEAEDKCDEILFKAERSNTKKQKNEVDLKIAAVLLDFENEVNKFVTEEMAKIVESETDYLDSVVGPALGISLAVPATALSILSMVPIANAGIPKEFGKYAADGLRKIYDSMTNQSYVFGETYEDLNEQYKSRFNAYNRGLDAEAETVGYSLPDEFDRIVYTKNDKNIYEYVWISILDTTTCLECASLSNTRYEKVEDVPYFPRHERDRCKILAITKDMEDQIPESYSDWFEKQPKDNKYKILGKTRFQLYEQGMKIKQFVNNGKKTPLKNLSKYTSFSSEKAKDILNKQQPVNQSVLNRVIKGLNKNGYSVQIGKDTDKLLELWGKEAYVITTNDGKAAIVFHSKLSASGLFEEIIHTAQTRKFGYEYCQLHIHELEVEAKLKLLKYAKSYGITDYEKEVIKEDLIWHKSQIKEE